MFDFPKLSGASMVVLLCFALMPWFTNCTHIGTANGVSGATQSSDDKIQPEELYGVWTFNEFTRKHLDRLESLGLKELSTDDNTIEIAKDGTCRFNTYTSFHPSGYHLISTGKWSLKKTYDGALEAETWQIEFELRPDSVRVVEVPFYLKRESDRLKMYDFIDDPDQNQLVEFERTFAKSSGD
jgi:hypothetical protein